MAVKGSLETSLGISAAAPADFTIAEYRKLTFTTATEAINIGEFGREYNVVTALNLAEGATRKFKGSYNNGSLNMELLFDSEDAGQGVFEAASIDRKPYYFRVRFPGGTGAEEFFFEALVTSAKRMVGGPDDALKMRINVEITHREILEGTQE